MGLRSGEFAGQLRTGIPWSLNQVLVALALCAGAKSCWKWNLHLHKLVSRQEAWSALKLLVYGLCWPWTSENTVDQHQQMTWHPKPSLTVETLHWTSSNVDSVPLLSSSRLWDPDFQRNAKFTFIKEHNFGPLSSSPVLFVFSPARRFWRLSVVQEWLDTRNATAETHVLHTSVLSGSWSSCSPLLWISPTFWMGFVSQSSPGCGYPYCLYTFFYHIFSFPSPLY